MRSGQLFKQISKCFPLSSCLFQNKLTWNNHFGCTSVGQEAIHERFNASEFRGGERIFVFVIGFSSAPRHDKNCICTAVFRGWHNILFPPNEPNEPNSLSESHYCPVKNVAVDDDRSPKIQQPQHRPRYKNMAGLNALIIGIWLTVYLMLC